MNIFYLDPNPRNCAQMHADKHVVKMILETAQLLSTAHRVIDGSPFITKNAIGSKLTRYVLTDERENLLYKSTHVNHPSAIWVRQSVQHYNWLYQLFHELIIEYKHRYGKVHASSKLLEILSKPPHNLVDNGFIGPTPAMDAHFIVANDPLLSYRNYYKIGKSDLLQYTKRDKPYWLLEEENE